MSEDRRSVALSPAGIDEVERILDVELYGDDAQTLAAVNIALYARMLVHRDVDYLVSDGEIRLIDPPADASPNSSAGPTDSRQPSKPRRASTPPTAERSSTR